MFYFTYFSILSDLINCLKLTINLIFFLHFKILQAYGFIICIFYICILISTFFVKNERYRNITNPYTLIIELIPVEYFNDEMKP